MCVCGKKTGESYVCQFIIGDVIELIDCGVMCDSCEILCATCGRHICPKHTKKCLNCKINNVCLSCLRLYDNLCQPCNSMRNIDEMMDDARRYNIYHGC